MVDESFTGEDMGIAETIVRRVYPKVRLRESRGDFRFTQSTRGADGVAFCRFGFSSDMDTTVELERVAAFGIVLSGTYEAHSRRRRLDTSRPFLFQPGSGGSRSSALDLLMVNVDLDRLGSAAARGLGVDGARIQLNGSAPVSSAMSDHWLRSVLHTWRSVVQIDEVFRNDLTRTATFDAVVAAALAAFPVTAVATGRQAPDGALSSAVQRAKRFIEDHPDRALTLESIAAEGRLSVRGMQKAFRRELDSTPLGYLRRVRLEEARAELESATPEEASVTAIALRWGFTNSGRFAATYRAAFGENPGTTLRR